MPRVTDAYRRARRDEIAHAALRVLARQGVTNTVIADIVAESGLSAGAIYSHFTNKAELARSIAGSLLGRPIDRIAALTRQGVVSTPVEVMTELLGLFDDDEGAAEVVLQFWGLATNDPELRAAMAAELQSLHTAFGAAVRPWIARRHAAAEVDAAMDAAVQVMVGVCQGYIVQRALFGPRPIEDYLTQVAALFERSSDTASFEPGAPMRKRYSRPQ